MLVKRGIAVSPGIVTGPAFVLGTEVTRARRRFVPASTVDAEIARLHSALAAVAEQLEEHRHQATEQLGEQYGRIFGAHLEMARDPALVRDVEELIRQKSYSPEYAAAYSLDRSAKMLRALPNQHLAERAADILDLKKRILQQLQGEQRQVLENLKSPVVVLAGNLTPSETARLNRELVLGFATEVGGHTSHTAILAGALEIPAIVGVGEFLSEVSGGETVILDGNRGELIIEPDQETLRKYVDTRAKIQSVSQRRESLSALPAETSDGVRIQLMGNIEFPEEVEHCTERGADGVGLYRTEFLYLGNDFEPTEEDHFRAYQRVVSAFPDKPVVIRTLDLGADKTPQALDGIVNRSPNPVLGLRSIRMSLQNQTLFKTQLRAILKAAVGGDVRIMFPLVSSLLEIRQARMMVGDVIEDLEDDGDVEFARDVPIGMMVEVPSAVLLIEEFAREVDFFSIGTNDLIQYTLAVDRSDPAVASLYNSGDPAILRQIQRVVDVANDRNLPVTVCGQMSSDPVYAPLLIGLGLRQLSVAPQAIPELKEVIRQLTLPQAKRIAKHAMSLELARDVESYLHSELKKISPDSMR